MNKYQIAASILNALFLAHLSLCVIVAVVVALAAQWLGVPAPVGW